jgi:transcriptional regulator of acetoin/glycerol metabolism
LTPERQRKIIREVLEDHNWQVVVAIAGIRRLLWVTLMEECNWQVSTAAKRAGVYRSQVHSQLKSLGIRIVRDVKCSPHPIEKPLTGKDS